MQMDETITLTRRQLETLLHRGRESMRQNGGTLRQAPYESITEIEQIHSAVNVGGENGKKLHEIMIGLM